MRRDSGFTLLETLVSLTIMSILSLILFYTFRGIVTTREFMDENADIQTMGRIAVDRVERELSMAFLSALPSPQGNYQTRFFAEDNDPIDLLSFTSLSHERMVQDAKESDQTELSYFGEDDNASRYFMLMHREAPRIDDDMERGGVVHPLAHNVKRFNLRYYHIDKADPKKRKWHEDWDSESADFLGQLPYMVTISLVLADFEGTEFPFRGRVILHHPEPLGREHTPGGVPAPVRPGSPPLGDDK